MVGGVKKVAVVPIWVKLTPSTSSLVSASKAAYEVGAFSIPLCDIYTSLPLKVPETIKIEGGVDGLVTSGGLAGLAILHQALKFTSDISRAFLNSEILGIFGIHGFREAFNFFVPCARYLKVCTAAMQEKGSGSRSAIYSRANI